MLEASKELQRSQKLRILLEVVLAFGNYMNRGARGNASGKRFDYYKKHNCVDLEHSLFPLRVSRAKKHANERGNRLPSGNVTRA